MNKLFTKIAGLSIGLAMAIGVGVAAGSGRDAARVDATTVTGEFALYNSAMAEGDYVFVTQYTASSKSYTKALKNSVTSNKLDEQSVTVSSNKVTNPDDSIVWHIAPSSTSGYWTIQNTANNKYLASTGQKSQATLVDTVTDYALFSMTLTGGKFVTENKYNKDHSVNAFFRHNKSASGAWACYASDTAPTLYKKAVQNVTVTFNANGHGAAPAAQTIQSGGKATQPTSPTATGWTFGGWYENSSCTGSAWNFNTTISADKTLWAKWTANQYNINYFDQGGSAFSGSHESGYPTKHTYGTATTLKGATKGGYDFDGWFTNSACTGSAVTTLGATSYTDNISLYAKWTATGTTYSITTTVSNGTYSGDTTITDNGGVASVTIAPTGDYKLPTSVSVSGASHTYDANTGVISLSKATGNVTIDAAMVALTEYSITVNETNGSHTGASVIKESRTATLTFTPTSGWGQPADVTVSGATKSWVRGTGVLTLSNPTGNVTVTYAAVENELESITLSANSGTYTLGEGFVKPTVTAHYTVAADAEVTNSPNLVITGYDPYTTGTQPVTITYTEGGIQKSASYTATVNAKSVETITTWEKTELADLTSSDEFVITRTSSTTVALPNDGGAATPTKVDITISNNKITSTVTDSLKWNVSGNSNDGYVFYPKGSTTNWLYLLADNNSGVRIGDGSNKHFTLNQGYLYTEETTSPRMIGVYNNADWRCYKLTNEGEPHANIADQTFGFFKKVETQVGTASLIRIVCDPTIDSETGYKGGEKYIGDKVYTTDFVVKKQLDTGNELTAITGFTINGGSEVVLTDTSNTITVSYTEGGIPKSTEVVVAATERAAELESVQLVEKGEVKKSGYIDFASATWNLDNIYVHYYWSDDDFDTEVTLASLVATDDATIDPEKPTAGATSFTVSYEYLEVEITNNTITLTEAVKADYVASISWTGTKASHFKAFSGGQLTAAQVSEWSVVPTFAGAGAQSALSFGQYILKVGSKTISSLPYTWASEDDGQELSITYGKDKDGNDFVKKNGTAKGNICATINAIDHDEIITPGYEEHVEAYVKITNVNNVTSGKYIIAYEGDSTHHAAAFDGSLDTDHIDANLNFQSIAFDGDNIEMPDEDNFYVNITKNTNDYTITTASGVHVGHSGGSNGFNKTGNNTISFNQDGTVNITGTGGINLQYNYANKTERFRYFASTQGAIYLFKYVNETIIHPDVIETTHYANQMEHFDAQKAVVAFANFMNTTMNGTDVCSGSFANLEDAWNDVADKYDELFGEDTKLSETELAWAKNMLRYATAAWGSDAEIACVEKAMKTYEFCIAKHGVDPFMFDGTTPLRSVSSTPSISTLISKNSSVVIIIAVISALSAAAIGGYFLFRRRKEQ